MSTQIAYVVVVKFHPLFSLIQTEADQPYDGPESNSGEMGRMESTRCRQTRRHPAPCY